MSRLCRLLVLFLLGCSANREPAPVARSITTIARYDATRIGDFISISGRVPLHEDGKNDLAVKGVLVSDTGGSGRWIIVICEGLRNADHGAKLTIVGRIKRKASGDGAYIVTLENCTIQAVEKPSP